MRNVGCWLLAFGLWTGTVQAQKIEVEQFKKVKKDLLNQTPLPIDKKLATLDFLTDEKGFAFKADGKVDVQAEEGDGMITLLAPHKTKFLLIKHPEYGQTTWKVPDRKGLKKKKHYQAILLTDKPGKEYTLGKQWVVFQITPVNAIVEVDSMMARVRDGLAQFNLTVGRHRYRVDAPFHEAVEDTLEVTDSAKLLLPVTLQSFYSYLTVKQPLQDGVVFVDGQTIGKGGVTSGRLHTGKHRLQIYRKGDCYLDSVFTIRKAEKKVIEVRNEECFSRKVERDRGNEECRVRNVECGMWNEEGGRRKEKGVSSDSSEKKGEAAVEKGQYAEVTITAADDSTEIWVNREPMGMGKWEGRLEMGYYTVNTLKGGLESKTISLWVDDTQPKILDLSAPQASYGLLNIHSNVIGATVKVNGAEVGQTPCIVENLPASKSCTVLLTKRGYLDVEAVVTPIGNDMLDVELKMKKK